MSTDERPDLDTTFRCVHWACTLAHKHCLRRQAELYRKPGKTSSGKHFVKERAAHPYCASGECEQGAAIRAQFPDVQHQQHDPRTAPRLDIIRAVEEQAAMPKGQLNQKRTCCDTLGGRHKATCSTQRKAPAPSAEGRVKAQVTSLRPLPARRAAGKPSKVEAGLREAPLDELLRQRSTAADLIAAVDAELVRRQREIAAALDQAKRPAAAGEG